MINENGGKKLYLALSWIYLCVVVLLLDFPSQEVHSVLLQVMCLLRLVWLTYSLSLRSLTVSSLIV